MPEESNQKRVRKHSGLYVNKQVLILNITRLGDVIQTVPLIHRLHHEWPGVAIDLVVDQQLAGMAELLTGVRRVLTRDFRDLRSLAPTAPTLPCELVEWARTLAATGYDRLINLTFTPQSGRLAALFQVPDTRGVLVGVGNTPIVKNPWLAHVVDLHHVRSFNRFNIADLYALGGSGPGPCQPITLSAPHHAEQWTNEFIGAKADRTNLVAVHAGASNAIKAWRPEHFGCAMAALSQQTAVTFVLIGTGADRESATQVMQAYRAAGGTATVLDAIGHTTIPQLAALLARCQLVLSGDSGPMHVAVGVGTPVIDLSVGHASPHDTGPYGAGHWVMQPVMECAPCSYQQVCAHHSCKDQIVPDQLAALAGHVLDHAPFPSTWTGVRVYESDIDADGLACHRLRAGQYDSVAEWYGTFWRRYWYEVITGLVSGVDDEQPPPVVGEQQHIFQQLAPIIDQAVALAEQIAEGSRHQPMPLSMLKERQTELTELRNRAMPVAMASPAFGPITVALVREFAQCEVTDVTIVADLQAQAYRRWKARMEQVMENLQRGQQKRERPRASVHRDQQMVEVSL